MALQAATAKDSQFVIVCMAPDVCFTPKKPYYPIPYPITHKFDQTKKPSKNVFFAGKPAYRHKVSFVDNVTGDQPGKGGGVISQVNVKISHNIDKSDTVFVNNKPIVRTGDTVWMNWKKK
jgi:ribosomal protein S28E/S33